MRHKPSLQRSGSSMMSSSAGPCSSGLSHIGLPFGRQRPAQGKSSSRRRAQLPLAPAERAFEGDDAPIEASVDAAAVQQNRLNSRQKLVAPRSRRRSAQRRVRRRLREHEEGGGLAAGSRARSGAASSLVYLEIRYIFSARAAANDVPDPSAFYGDKRDRYCIKKRDQADRSPDAPGGVRLRLVPSRAAIPSHTRRRVPRVVASREKTSDQHRATGGRIAQSPTDAENPGRRWG